MVSKNNKHLFSHYSGGQKSKFKGYSKHNMFEGYTPTEVSWGDSFPASFSFRYVVVEGKEEGEAM